MGAVTVNSHDTPLSVAGEWSITITFISGSANHTAIIRQDGNKLTGVYKGTFKEGVLRGTVKGNTIDFTGYLKHEATNVSFHYTGVFDGKTMTGNVDMGEYWKATWTAKPVKEKK